jgi:hypothetical protein
VPVAGKPVFFFVHVMKTGGTSFVRHLRDNFEPDELEVQGIAGETGKGRAIRPGDTVVYDSLSRLRDLPPERRRRIRAYAGHYPYCATELVDVDVTMTILREPVARSVSMLRQLQRRDPPDQARPLEEIYDTAPGRWQRVQNYQSRQFALTFDDIRASAELVEAYVPGGGADALDRPAHVYLEVDDARLARAKENLARVHVLGLQERYDEFLDQLATRHGWHIPRRYRLQVATNADTDVPPSLRRKIVDDNAADIELYRWAVDELARRG